MVGIAPDYRTKNRFDTSPLASVADGRATFDWVVEHADELGIDPMRIAVGGTSAVGHGFSNDAPEWKLKVRTKMEELLKREGLLPAVR